MGIIIPHNSPPDEESFDEAEVGDDGEVVNNAEEARRLAATVLRASG